MANDNGGQKHSSRRDEEVEETEAAPEAQERDDAAKRQARVGWNDESDAPERPPA